MGILDSCPFALLKQLAVAEVDEFYWWRKDGCVDPLKIPVPLRRAISAYAAGIARRFHETMSKD